MRACFVNYWVGEAASGLIKKTGTAHFQDAATLLNRDCLLLQQVNKRLAHLVPGQRRLTLLLKYQHPYEVDGFPVPVGGCAVVR
ncbi:MAG: hypothetical protein K8R50_02565, partial [Betaproteobacteria bacterium]|nr:hypothetical protein [Betaproteobacteria bacterium]